MKLLWVNKLRQSPAVTAIDHTVFHTMMRWRPV